MQLRITFVSFIEVSEKDWSERLRVRLSLWDGLDDYPNFRKFERKIEIESGVLEVAFGKKRILQPSENLFFVRIRTSTSEDFSSVLVEFER